MLIYQVLYWHQEKQNEKEKIKGERERERERERGVFKPNRTYFVNLTINGHHFLYRPVDSAQDFEQIFVYPNCNKNRKQVYVIITLLTTKS